MDTILSATFFIVIPAVWAVFFVQNKRSTGKPNYERSLLKNPLTITVGTFPSYDAQERRSYSHGQPETEQIIGSRVSGYGMVSAHPKIGTVERNTEKPLYGYQETSRQSSFISYQLPSKQQSTKLQDERSDFRTKNASSIKALPNLRNSNREDIFKSSRQESQPALAPPRQLPILSKKPPSKHTTNDQSKSYAENAKAAASGALPRHCSTQEDNLVKGVSSRNESQRTQIAFEQQPKRQNVPKQPPTKQHGVQKQDEWREYYARHVKLMRALPKLRCSQIRQDIYHAVNCGKLNLLPVLENFSKFSRANYGEALPTLLYCEEAYSAVMLRKFDRFGCKLEWRSGQVGYTLPGVSEKNPSLVPGDLVVLHECELGYTWSCDIHSVEGDFIMIAPPRRTRDNYEQHPGKDWSKLKYDISFVSSGLPYLACHKAIERCVFSGRSFFEIAFQDTSLQEGTSTRAPYDWHNISDNLAKLNERQRQAVLAIVAAEFKPRPYILFGPPGTGKTATLIEAIVQVYKSTSAKILVCANSNVCVDDIHYKLLERDLDEPNMVRLSAGERAKSREIMNKLERARIVVTTSIKASSMNDTFRFDYIFLDEAGHAHEAESLIPLSLMRLTQNSSSLILAGDPKQLGPVVQMRSLEKIGFGRSMLERLFEEEIYKKDSRGNYNPSYITKLLVSYRCDERIMAPSNKLFYDNQLKCPNRTPKSILRMLNLTSPLVMSHVQGQETNWGESTSWANVQEAEACTDLVLRLYEMGFEPDQIGVITPYRLQMKCIRDKLAQKLDQKRNLLDDRFMQFEDDLAAEIDKLELGGDEVVGRQVRNGLQTSRNQMVASVRREKKPARRQLKLDWMCEINTVDAFQGSEMDIIIVSTVRTNPGSGARNQLGFLNDGRRFNVAISRSRWLAMIVGNRHVLENMQFWPEFLRLSQPLQRSRPPPPLPPTRKVPDPNQCKKNVQKQQNLKQLNQREVDSNNQNNIPQRQALSNSNQQKGNDDGKKTQNQKTCTNNSTQHIVNNNNIINTLQVPSSKKRNDRRRIRTRNRAKNSRGEQAEQVSSQISLLP